jgi:hypothetical protein
LSGGSPGQAEAACEATLKLAEDVRFDGAFSVSYSARPGTPAAALADETTYAVKLARLQRLQARLQELSEEYSAAMVGTRDVDVDRSDGGAIPCTHFFYIEESLALEQPGAAGRNDDARRPVDAPQRRLVEVIEVNVRDRHRINVLVTLIVHRHRLAADVPHPVAQDGIGQHAHSVHLHQAGGVADVGQTHSSLLAAAAIPGDCVLRIA